MPDFGSCSTNIADITDDQFCQGFGGCGVDGVPVTSGNLNGVLALFQEAITAAGVVSTDQDSRITVLENAVDNVITGATYDDATNILTFNLAEGGTVDVDLTDLIEDIIATNNTPAGLIALWSGITIPTGWALCDGTSGTPDLRDRFVVGSGGAYTVGDTGGSDNHDHGAATGTTQLTELDIPEHRHFAVIPGTATGSGASAGVSPYEASNSGGDTEYSLDFAATEPTASRTSAPVTMAGSAITPSAGHDHSINSASNMPPYYALAFIMKV